MHNLKVENYVSCGGCTEDLGLPWWLRGKESACSTGDSGSFPGSGRSPGEGIGYALQYSWASLVTQLVKKQPAMRRPRFDP